jgi:hypothetical protein
MIFHLISCGMEVLYGGGIAKRLNTVAMARYIVIRE